MCFSRTSVLTFSLCLPLSFSLSPFLSSPLISSSFSVCELSFFCVSLAEEEIKPEPDVMEGMDMSIQPKVPALEPGSAEKALVAQKRKLPSPQHSSNGHSPSAATVTATATVTSTSTSTSPSPIKKKKKPGIINTGNKDQDGRNDFYCWVCHREGQVLCCELCPRVYHAKCLKLAAEPEGDWFCPECEKITVAECIETQSKAMTMLTLEQLSYLLKFALQKMKQPGTEPFQKPVSLEQHPDYAEYIFHPMDLCTLEKNMKKKMYGCTEAFLADVKWILHNCIIYNGGNHKLTATAKVIVKICEHEMSEIEVCPECYLSACQKRDNWFCEPCCQPHPLVWAKLKGFPFWPAKALREKDGQVDARFFGQHDRAWVPINNCYLMSKEIPFSVKKTKSIFNSAMQEMEVYVENIRKKFGVFNYAPFRTPYTPNNQLQMLQDPSNPAGGTVRLDKQEKIKFSFDMTASPKMLLGKSMMSGPGGSAAAAGRRISMSDMPRSPMSTNSSVHTGSDAEPDSADRGARIPHYSTGEDSMDYTASPASKMGVMNSTDSPKTIKQERGPTGGILNLNLDRIKAEMDLKELSESVQQQQQQQQQLQGTPTRLSSARRPLRSLDKTIENCKAQLGIDELSEDVYRNVEHSDSEDSDKSDSSDSEYMSDEDQKPKGHAGSANSAAANATTDKESKRKSRTASMERPERNGGLLGGGSSTTGVAAGTLGRVDKSGAVEGSMVKKEKQQQHHNSSSRTEKDEKPRGASLPQQPQKAEAKAASSAAGADVDSDSDKELVIDLGEESGRDRKRARREAPTAPAINSKAPSSSHPASSSFSAENTSSSTPAGGVKDFSHPPVGTPLNLVSFPALASSTLPPGASSSSSSNTSSSSPAAIPTTLPSSAIVSPPSSSSPSSMVKKQRPLLPKDSGASPQTLTPQQQQQQQRTVVWNPATATSGAKFQTSSQKWQMQKVQQQQGQGTQVQTQAQAQVQTQGVSAAQQAQSSSTRYQTRQSLKGAQPKDSSQAAASASASVSSSLPSSSSSSAGDFTIPTGSADQAADIAKYTTKIMDAIKGTMTEIYNDLSKNTSGNTIAEIRRLRIEIDKLQWLHQQELSEMKHNLELTMAEMRQSLEQERERLVAEVRKQSEAERQQAVDETKKKQWCANCRKEAIFYCCWNTSYCDYPCQQAHWPEHMKSCTQSATASQQETEAVAPSEALARPSGQSPSAQQHPSPAMAASGQANRDPSPASSGPGVSVS
ncbi:MYND-type zinc finger-containing chromatin reader ZMYND8-like isoform X3 [Engraulis encrasicolus]|uniref:MYND-type zinc finger-containing chromatin reader ZMYND8-like isoform X3 n=1 Tax=Engraulis encrasicolus TaxID=184585 RepID=UPI002FD5F21D